MLRKAYSKHTFFTRALAKIAAIRPGKVAHIYNISNSGSRNQEGYGLTPARAKSYQDSISISKFGMVVHAYDPSYAEGHV
jgi:hypothetical protein